jgi:hypothetical protein
MGVSCSADVLGAGWSKLVTEGHVLQVEDGIWISHAMFWVCPYHCEEGVVASSMGRYTMYPRYELKPSERRQLSAVAMRSGH